MGLVDKLYTKGFAGTELVAKGSEYVAAYAQTGGERAQVMAYVERGDFIYATVYSATSGGAGASTEAGHLVRIHKGTLKATWFFSPPRSKMGSAADNNGVSASFAVTLNGSVMCILHTTTGPRGARNIFSTYDDNGVRTDTTMDENVPWFGFHCVDNDTAYSYSVEAIFGDPTKPRTETEDQLKCWRFGSGGNMSQQHVTSHDRTQYAGLKYEFYMSVANTVTDICTVPWCTVGLLPRMTTNDAVVPHQGWVRVYGGGGLVRWSRSGILVNRLSSYNADLSQTKDPLTHNVTASFYYIDDAPWALVHTPGGGWDPIPLQIRYYDYTVLTVLYTFSDGRLLIYVSMNGATARDRFGVAIVNSNGVVQVLKSFAELDYNGRATAMATNVDTVSYYETEDPNVLYFSSCGWTTDNGIGVLDLHNGILWSATDYRSGGGRVILTAPEGDGLYLYELPTLNNGYFMYQGAGTFPEKHKVKFSANTLFNIYDWNGELVNMAGLSQAMIQLPDSEYWDSLYDNPTVIEMNEDDEFQMGLSIIGYGVNTIERVITVPNSTTINLHLAPVDIDGGTYYINSVEDFMKITPYELWIEEDNKPPGFWDAYGTYILTADLDFKGMEITPRFAWEDFYGVFDGGGHTISNLIVTGEDEWTASGLFSSGLNSRFKDLTLKNITIQHTSSSYPAGILIAMVRHSTVLLDGMTGRPVQFSRVFIEDSAIHYTSDGEVSLGGCVGLMGIDPLEEGTEARPADLTYFDEVAVGVVVEADNGRLKTVGIAGAIQVIGNNGGGSQS